MTEVKQPQDHMRGKKNPVTRTTYICNDTELADHYYELNEEMQMLRMRMANPPVPEETQRRYDKLEPELKSLAMQIRESALMFQFKSIGRKAFDKLISEHPPTDDTRKKLKEAGEAEDALRWDPETFFPALVEKACCLKPEDINLRAIWNSEDWNESELGELSQAALAANLSRRIVPLGNA